MAISARPILFRTIILLAFSLAVGACGGGGGGGGGSAAPPTSEALALPEDSSDLNVSIDGVTINSAPVWNFTITNENGTGVLVTQEDCDAGRIRFGLAKLVPGTSGDNDAWQNYVNTIEVPTPGVGPGGVPAVPGGAMQGTVEARSGCGTLTDNGGGSYTYVMATDVADPTQTMGVTFDGALLHRAVMQVEFDGLSGEIVKNPFLDFVPDGTAAPATKNIVRIEKCNECHQELAFHGGGRIDTKFCVACHNPGTTDANSGNNLNLAVLVHKIHTGEDLTNLPYEIWGFRDSVHDYSTVAWPQDVRNCTTCHDGDTDSDNWKLRPTQQACGACHDDVVFATGENHGDAESPDYPCPPGPIANNPDGTPNNTNCSGCHRAQASGECPLGPSVEDAHRLFPQEAVAQFQYNFLGVSFDAGSREVTVTFSVTDPTNNNQRYDVNADQAFAESPGSLGFLFGWDAKDFNNTGSGEVPAQPISVNAVTDAVNNGDNTFNVTATLPVEASGTGIVAMQGHPAAVNPATGVAERIPVPNAFEYFAITGEIEERRQIVSIDKCNKCHKDLSLHGSNRQGAIEVCVICHNANGSDIDVRPATLDSEPDGIFDDFAATGIDGKREEAIHLKHMIHAIHAGDADEHGFRENGIVLYGFRRSINDFSEVRFPGILSNCNGCHVNDSWALGLPSTVLATTLETASAALSGDQTAIDQALATPDDDLNVSPIAATCSSCHDTNAAREHMEVLGNAVFDQTQSVISSSVLEGCDQCHGPGEVADVTLFHDIRPE